MMEKALIEKKLIEQSSFLRYFSRLGDSVNMAVVEGRVDTLLWVLGVKREVRAKAIEKEVRV